MPKKLVWLVCAVLLCAFLGGCQLAREDVEEENLARDKLVGVYISFQHLHYSSAENSFEETNNPDAEPRFYATAKQVDDDGYTSTTFEFEGLDGIPFFMAKVISANEVDSFYTKIRGPEILDSSINHNYAGISLNGKTADPGFFLTGKIEVVEPTEVVLHLNPVYQTKDGKIYMLPGETGVFISKGAAYKTTLFETTTVTENGEETTSKTSVELSAEVVSKPVKVIFKEMNGQDAIIRTTEITPENIPDSIHLQPDCAYAIVETHSSGENGLEVTRTLLDLEAGYYIYKYQGERGCLIGKMIEIRRKGED